MCILWLWPPHVALLFCDEREACPEQGRAPATQALLSVFVAHLATAYSGRTISGYLNGVRAWHILHSLP